MLVVVLPLPLSSSMYDGEFDHSGDGGVGGGPVVAVVVTAAVAAVEDNYWQKRPATRASTVA
jgi:hypothetical protein